MCIFIKTIQGIHNDRAGKVHTSHCKWALRSQQRLLLRLRNGLFPPVKLHKEDASLSPMQGIKCLSRLLTDMPRRLIFCHNIISNKVDDLELFNWVIKTKFYNILIKLMILCWAEFWVIVRHMHPVGHSLDMSARLIYAHFIPLRFLPVI